VSRLLLIGLISVAACAQTATAAIEKLENIRTIVREFALQEVVGDAKNVSVSVGALDPRLRLNACAEPLIAYFATGTKTLGQTNIGLRCAGPKAWSLFVPVTIDRQIMVAVSLEHINRGDIIGAGDIAYELRSLTKLSSGYFSAADPIIGQVSTRQITPHSVFARNMLKPARLVRRGDRVTLALYTGSVAIRVTGEAMSDGTRGERIPVRNLSSRRIIKGVVREPGLVVVGQNVR
jgi:flagella basal body P-ring formation protein FlgA